jgi:hypothetical protein
MKSDKQWGDHINVLVIMGQELDKEAFKLGAWPTNWM